MPRVTAPLDGEDDSISRSSRSVSIGREDEYSRTGAAPGQTRLPGIPMPRIIAREIDLRERNAGEGAPLCVTSFFSGAYCS